MNIPFRSDPLARVIPVIHVRTDVIDGSGAPVAPLRFINMYFSLDGVLLACYNESIGPPDGPAHVGEEVWEQGAV